MKINLYRITVAVTAAGILIFAPLRFLELYGHALGVML